MSERPQDIGALRELAARLRSLAVIEPTIADQLRRIAEEADDRADAAESRRDVRRPS